MNRSDYYSYSPEWIGMGYRPDNPIGRLPLAPRYEEHKPPHKDGFMIDNNARLEYTAVFNFIYDEHMKLPTEIRVNVGDRITITFNKGKEGRVIITTVRGIVTKIKPIKDTNKFILTLDASTPNNSCVLNIGSRVILDIVKLDKDEDCDKSDIVEEVVDGSYGVEDLPDIIPPHHHGHHKPPMPPGPPPCDHIPPTMHSNHIDWMKLEVDKDESRGYNVLNITYAKKDPVDVLLCICDRAGNVLHKALDTSKRISMGSNFTWTFRNYIKEVNKLSTIEKLQNYTVDSVANYVMLERDKENEYIKDIEESSLTFIENLNVVVQLVTGPNLLMYNPRMNCKHRGYEVESRFYNITPEILLGAVKSEEENPPKEDDPTPPVEGPSGDDNKDPVTPPSSGEDNKSDENLNLNVFELDTETNTYSIHDGKYTGLTYKDEGTYTKTEDDGSYTIIKDNLVDTCIVTNIKYNIPAMFSMRARAIDVNSNNNVTVTVTSFKYNEEGEVTYEEPEIETPKFNTKIFVPNETDNTLSLNDNSITGVIYLGDGIYSKSSEGSYTIIKDNLVDTCTVYNSIEDTTTFTYTSEGAITYAVPEVIIPDYNNIIFNYNESDNTLNMRDDRYTNLIYVGNNTYTGLDSKNNIINIYDDKENKKGYVNFIDSNINTIYPTTFTYTESGSITHEYPKWYKNIPPETEWFCYKNNSGTYNCKDQKALSYTNLRYLGDNQYEANTGQSTYYVLTLMGNGVCKKETYSKTSTTADPVLKSTTYIGYIYKCTDYSKYTTVWSQNVNTEIFTKDNTYSGYGNCYKHNSIMNMNRAKLIGNGVYIDIHEADSSNNRTIYISIDDFKGTVHSATITLDSNNNMSSGITSSSSVDHIYGIRGDTSKYTS